MMIRACLIVALALSAVACGGGDNDGGNPTAPSRSQAYTETVTGTVSSFGWTFHPLTVPRSGQMTLSLQGFGTGDLDLYLVSASCTGYPLTSCQMLAKADGPSNTETLLRTVAAGETFRIVVDNFVFQSMNYELRIRID